MYDVVEIQCPWCFDRYEISIPKDLWGETVQDCETCCRPWQMVVSRDGDGDPQVALDRLDD